MQIAEEKQVSPENWASFLVDVNQLRDAITVGDLKRRLSTEGQNREAAAASQSINTILDTIFGYLDRTVASVHGMTIGQIPEPFPEEFPGDFAPASHVCNQFIDVINRRNVQIKKMTEGASRGDLHIRAKVEEFIGVNRRIFEGFNAMFDAWLAPVNEIERVLSALERMDLTERVKGAYQGEYDRIATSLNTVCSRLAAEVLRIKEDTKVIASTSEELSAITKEAARGAIENSRLAASVAKSSEEVSSSLSAVAIGSGQMLNSIQEISQNTSKAAGAVQSAVSAINSTSEKIAHLDESSVQINKVVKVITGIAQQTNLLALNATIEAARAGTAGKGFAVVASEVKDLAKGTAKATEEVGERIAAIQRDTQETVAGITNISTVTQKISEISQIIAAAVEQQTATTNEMGRHVSGAADIAAQIAREMAGLAQSAQTTSSGATHTEAALQGLNNVLKQLQTFVASFTV